MTGTTRKVTANKCFIVFSLNKNNKKLHINSATSAASLLHHETHELPIRGKFKGKLGKIILWRGWSQL
jgi:hypothetical protein